MFALSGGPFFFNERGVEHSAHIGPAQSQRVRARKFAGERVAEQNAGRFARQSIAVSETGVGQRTRRDVECEPVREVRRAEGAADHAESDAVELVAFDDSSLGQVRAVGRAGVGGEIIFEPQPFRRHAAECAALGEHIFPQLTRRACVGIDARHADDGDGGGRGVHAF